MFFGLLTTCGLENTGPEHVDTDGVFWSQHGSINHTEATDIEVAPLHDGVRICGSLNGNPFGKHHFNMRREIVFCDNDSSIRVHDVVVNNGERDQICIMYHYNIGAPFLSEDCVLDIPYQTAVPKNEEAAKRMSKILNVSSPSNDEARHVFYMRLEKEPSDVVRVVNTNFNLELLLSVGTKTLPKLDMWKSLVPDPYVLSLEPCNSFPYGRVPQQEKGEALFLEKGECVEYETIISIKELKNE